MVHKNQANKLKLTLISYNLLLHLSKLSNYNTTTRSSSPTNCNINLAGSLLSPDHFLCLKPLGVHEHGVDAEAAFGVGAVDLRHGELEAHGRRRRRHEVAGVVQDPAPRLVVQVPLRHGVLAVRGRQLEPHGLPVPPVDAAVLVVRAAATAAGVLGDRLPELNSEVEAVGPRREAEVDLADHLEPPDLLEVRDGMESAQKLKVQNCWRIYFFLTRQR